MSLPSPPLDRRRAVPAWIGGGLLAIAVVLLLEHARPLLLPVTVAIVFAFVLSAPVRALRRAGVHEYVGAGLVVSAVLVVIVAIGMLIAAPAAAWWSRAPAIVQELLEAMQRWRDMLLPYATPAALTRATPGVAAPSDGLGEQLVAEGWSMTRLAIGNTLSFAVSASATVILLYFLLASEHWLVARTVAALRHPRTRVLVVSAFREAERDIGLFIASIVIINVALGTATGLALWAIGLPNPVLWGTTTAVLSCVPYLGPLLVAVLLLLAGSVTFGTGAEMMAPPAAFLLLHGIEANLLSPLFMGHRLRLSPVFVFLSVLLWGWLWGVAGAFIAVPLLLGLRAASKRIRRLRLLRFYLEGR